MKHNWTYRPFMECIENVKYTTKLQTKDFAQQGTYPVISQDESYISGYWDNADDVFHAKRPLVIFGDHTRVLKYINFDFVLGADGVKILLPTEDIIAKYMYYYLKWYNVPSLGYSRHFKLLRDIEFPIPSLDEQQAIVRELDGINLLIDLQEEQLREYDRLAQSLFYTTFGDPTTNPKGWEVKSWSDVLEIINGKNQSAVANPNGKYLLCGSGGEMGRADDYLCEEDSVIIGRKGNINRPLLMREKFWNVDTAFGLHPKKDVLLVDYLYQFCVSFDFENLNVAVTIPSLRKIDLLKIQIPLPPLALQQTFAAQIEAIEQQKTLIRRSLDETRTLLAARMQYYFE